jgi:hypothetical protein
MLNNRRLTVKYLRISCKHHRRWRKTSKNGYVAAQPADVTTEKRKSTKFVKELRLAKNVTYTAKKKSISIKWTLNNTITTRKIQFK